MDPELGAPAIPWDRQVALCHWVAQVVAQAQLALLLADPASRPAIEQALIAAREAAALLSGLST